MVCVDDRRRIRRESGFTRPIAPSTITLVPSTAPSGVSLHQHAANVERHEAFRKSLMMHAEAAQQFSGGASVSSKSSRASSSVAAADSAAGSRVVSRNASSGAGSSTDDDNDSGSDSGSPSTLEMQLFVFFEDLAIDQNRFELWSLCGSDSDNNDLNTLESFVSQVEAKSSHGLSHRASNTGLSSGTVGDGGGDLRSHSSDGLDPSGLAGEAGREGGGQDDFHPLLVKTVSSSNLKSASSDVLGGLFSTDVHRFRQTVYKINNFLTAGDNLCL